MVLTFIWIWRFWFGFDHKGLRLGQNSYLRILINKKLEKIGSKGRSGKERRKRWWCGKFPMSEMVTNSWRKYVTPCWRPTVVSRPEHCSNRGGDPSGRVDGLWWYKDIGQHIHGEFSMAQIQANNVLEDQCQVDSGPMSCAESGPRGTFVGIYDGHAGPEASRFINNHLFDNIRSMHLSLLVLCYSSLECVAAVLQSNFV